MPQVSLIRLLLCASVCCAFAQETSKLEFEVATIKASPPPEPGQGYTVGCKGGPGQTDPRNVPLPKYEPDEFHQPRLRDEFLPCDGAGLAARGQV